MRLFSSLLVLTLVSVSAGARENHCDHNSGKVGGAIAGGIIGGVLGAALGHGHAGNIAIGAGGGAIAGSVIGDNADDNKDFEECGTDAESFQRQVRRDEDRANEEAYREQRRADEIAYDREMSRRRHDGGYYPRYPRPMPMPRRPLPYQCQAVTNRHGRLIEYVLVYLPTNRVVQHWDYDQYGCQSSEAQANSGYRY